MEHVERWQFLYPIVYSYRVIYPPQDFNAPKPDRSSSASLFHNRPSHSSHYPERVNEAKLTLNLARFVSPTGEHLVRQPAFRWHAMQETGVGDDTESIANKACFKPIKWLK
jgi:hypothetical protein